MKAGELPLLGLHNARNIALAARATELFGGTAPQVIEALGSFAPLPHRMEKVPSTDGRTWIDDSLATVPEAVVATLRTLPQQRVSVIVGGADRGLDYQPLLDYLRTRTDITLVLIGPAGARIAAEWPLPQAGTVFATFSEAMSWARSSANPADVVLLSPGAPSFDEFADYEAKSAAFRAAAMLYC
jgi:UDP-N-acetylmuramoylalanine--D-glutamate ligase